MANTYEWKIASLDAKIAEGDLSNVIETVHWRLQATDGEHTADVYGSVGVELEGDFIPFEDLTQADIEGWLEAKLDVASLKEGLDAQIEAIKNPTHVSLNI